MAADRQTIAEQLHEAAVQGRIDAAVRVAEHWAQQDALKVQSTIGKARRELQYREAKARKAGESAAAEAYNIAIDTLREVS